MSVTYFRHPCLSLRHTVKAHSEGADFLFLLYLYSVNRNIKTKEWRKAYKTRRGDFLLFHGHCFSTETLVKVKVVRRTYRSVSGKSRGILCTCVELIEISRQKKGKIFFLYFFPAPFDTLAKASTQGA